MYRGGNILYYIELYFIKKGNRGLQKPTEATEVYRGLQKPADPNRKWDVFHLSLQEKLAIHFLN